MVFGCIGRIVTAAVLLIAGALLWHFRELWMPKVKAYFEKKAGEIEVKAPELPDAGLYVAPGVRVVFAEASSA